MLQSLMCYNVTNIRVNCRVIYLTCKIYVCIIFYVRTVPRLLGDHLRRNYHTHPLIQEREERIPPSHRGSHGHF